ncbi:TetR/AcrR family transcriptional regulator [Martelella alba]|uniref:TetR/AcrR family transcriptional regulator n=1 Tax=Martelella alba TaxID=2590451 RepID=UPI0015E87006|nr:TetR/AcrR family transcriptional regulator [Martelella alba]
MPATKSKKTAERTQRILDAAQEQFLETGLRGTTMETLARRARVAKPTLYAYFPDKEAVFNAVIARLMEDWTQIVGTALSSDGKPEERIARAFLAKFSAADDLISGSPHAEELMREGANLATRNASGLEDWLYEAIEALLVEHGFERSDAAHRSDMLVACVSGLYKFTGRRDQLAEDVAFVTRRLLG